MGWSALRGLADRAVLALLDDAVATYTPTDGDPTPVDGVFDAVYEFVDAGPAGISSSGPAFWCVLDDLPNDPETDPGARLTVNGTVYSIHTLKPDGQGTVRLLLHEV